MITETSFFRTPGAWLALARHLESTSGPLTLLSAGCSTGEEAYSLALLLLEQGREFEILAVDADPTLIAIARAGEFPATAIESQPGWGVLDPSAAGRHLTRRGDRYAVADHVAERVRFEVADLNDWRDQGWLPSRLDVAMVRNVWRYLSPIGRLFLAGQLHKRLDHGGVLVLGGADFLGAGLQPHPEWAQGVRHYFTESEEHDLIYVT